MASPSTDRQAGPDRRAWSKRRFAAIALSALAIAGGSLAGGACGDDDDEGLGEEAGKAIDTGAKELEQEVEKGAKKLDQEVDVNVDDDEGKKGKGKKK
jgi:hypothetical protein